MRGGLLTNFEVEAAIGDTIRAKVYSFDFDYNPNCLPQSIGFSASGLQLSSDTAYGNANNCSLNAPCATITSLNPGGGFNSITSNIVEFQWAVDATHLNYQGLQNSSASYSFIIKVSDNACPIPGLTTATLNVNIKDNVPEPPSLSKSCVNIVASSGDISFNATQSNDTADAFLGYYVYHSTNKMGPYNLIDTLSNHSLGSYTDAGRGPGPNYYFMRTVSTMLSPTSDTLSLMNLNINPSSGTPTVVTLNWNTHSSNQNAGTHYQVWKRNSNAAPWLLIDSTHTLTYIDTPFAVLPGLDYKIAIGGTCFSAKVNTIGLEEELLENVKVSPVPFNDELFISIPEELDVNTLQYELFSASGRRIVIQSEQDSNRLKLIGLKDLPHGVYILHLSANNKTKSFKLIH